MQMPEAHEHQERVGGKTVGARVGAGGSLPAEKGTVKSKKETQSSVT